MKKGILLLLWLAMPMAQAQTSLDTTTETTWNLLTYDVASIFKGMGHAYSRPLHWQGKDWLTFGGIAAGTGVLFIFDEETSTFFRNQEAGIPRFLDDYGTLYGSPQYNYMVTGGVYLTGLFTKNEKIRRTGVLLVSSASAAGFLQWVIKYPVGRARPTSGLSKDTFDPWNADRAYHSFPSGHAILAFTNAYAIAKQFKNPWVKAGIYTVGLIPGVSRLWRGDHWLTDVTLGIAISIFTVESIDRYLDSRYDQKYNEQQKKVSWDLQMGPGQVGVTMRF